jgi:hypothetical protein
MKKIHIEVKNHQTRQHIVHDHSLFVEILFRKPNFFQKIFEVITAMKAQVKVPYSEL